MTSWTGTSESGSSSTATPAPARPTQFFVSSNLEFTPCDYDLQKRHGMRKHLLLTTLLSSIILAHPVRVEDCGPLASKTESRPSSAETHARVKVDETGHRRLYKDPPANIQRALARSARGNWIGFDRFASRAPIQKVRTFAISRDSKWGAPVIATQLLEQIQASQTLSSRT